MSGRGWGLLLGACVAAGIGVLGASEREVLKAVRRVAPGPTARWREGEVIVAFREGTDEGAIERALREGGAARARRSRRASRVLARLDPGVTVEDAVRRFSARPEVDYAEPNGVVRKSQGRTLQPNDRFYEFQWNLTMVNAERTWGIQPGKSSVAVAVLDTGAAYEDYDDPVTGQQFRRAPDWGDVTFLPGYDFINDDAHPNDDEFHGTHVASTVAEETNNALGVAGLAFGCAIMPIKVLDEEGFGSFFGVADGVDYAVDFSQGGTRPVKVINMSLGSEAFSETLKRAVDRALAAGVVVVAAAGNSGTQVIEFPASITGVIAVGAVDARKERASYSNTGPSLGLVAPGGNCDRDDNNDDFGDCIFQQMPDPDFVAEGRHDQFCYCGLDGTSMATPHVAAAAALLISQGITDPAAVRAALEQTAERLGGAPAGGRNDTYGYGLIRPAVALSGLGFDLGPSP